MSNPDGGAAGSDIVLHALADGELDERAAGKVVDLLDRHPGRLEAFASLVRDKAALARAAGPDDEPDEETTALAESLGEVLARQERRERARRWFLRGAAVAAVFTAGWAGHTLHGTGLPGGDDLAEARTSAGRAADGQPRFVADAAGAHALFALDPVRPVEYTAEAEAQMRRRFASLLDAEIAVPHIDALGLRLVGGRLLGTAGDPIAHIVYESVRGDRLSLFVTRQAVPGGPEIRLAKVGTALAGYWGDGRLSYAVVEQAPGPDVGIVAAQVAELLHEG